jgi:phosphotransferase system enzyme I (PtsI)
MEIKRGIPVSPGLAIGPAFVLDTEWYRIPQRTVELALREREIERLHAALHEAADEVRTTQQAIADKVGKQYGAIFAAHALMIEDPALHREVESLIRDNGYAAEYAVGRVMRRYALALENLNRGFLATRTSDLFDIEKAILGKLLGQRREQLHDLKEPAIIVAHDLTPGETATLDRNMVQAFATEAGGRASHTAIMAGVLDIPAVVGLGKLLSDVAGGETIIIDGNHGVVILNPDEDTLERYERLRSSFRRFESGLTALRDLPAETLDGVRVPLLGNIEFPQEAAHCLERGANGVGLYRTEFLYVGRNTDPTEEEHLEAYMTVVKTLGPAQPVVIRTLDVGGDKFTGRNENLPAERNPFLGLRSTRLCLRNLTLFKTQMRAILRASAYGDVRIMFPMISTLRELRQCKMIFAEVKEDLEEEAIPFNREIPVGTMIEVPAAALMAEELAREVDFFSIGTNDLVQYTLAADRTNETVSDLYTPGDPAVLRLIDMVVKAAQKNNVSVNVCGEMSAEPIYTLLLLGLGLRQLSLTPHNIPEIKQVIRSVSIEEAGQVKDEVMNLKTAKDVNSYLKEVTRRILPEIAI